VLTAGVTTWTLPYSCTRVNAAVLSSSAFGTDHGKVIPLGNCAGTEVFAPGDYTAGCVIVGESYNFKIELSQFFLRDPAGQAITRGNLLVREARIVHRNSGYYIARGNSDNANIDDFFVTFASDTHELDEDGSTDLMIGLQSDDLTFTIESDQPQPVTIATVSAEVDHTDLAL
jgi:hypothetical protein